MFLIQHYNTILKYDLISKMYYTNNIEINKLNKIILNITSKHLIQNKEEILSLLFAIELLSGQKGVVTKVKKSISNFKIKKKMNLGCKLILIDEHMYNFLNYIIITLPKINDFNIIKKNNLKNGILSIGLINILIFLDIEYKYAKFVNLYGINLTFIPKNINNLDAQFLLNGFQFPIK